MIEIWHLPFIVWNFLIVVARGDFGHSCVARRFNYSSVVCVCNSTYCDTLPELEKTRVGTYQLYITSQDGARFHRTHGRFTNVPQHDFDFELTVHKTKRFQTILGFGGAFTDSTGYNINSLSLRAQAKILGSFFSRQGLEYNLCRVPIGGSDFSTHNYTYDDRNQDTSYSSFSLKHEDHVYKIPYIKQAHKLSGGKVKLFAAAWNAPIWMKTFLEKRTLSYVKKEYYQLWAEYHLRFLEEYKKAGLDIWALSTGNEPFLASTLNRNPDFMVAWRPTDQTDWIANHFGPTIRDSSFRDVLILGVDDQRSAVPVWMASIARNPRAYEYIDGIAVHWYFDHLIPASTTLDDAHSKYPDKFLLYTEASNCGIYGTSENGVNLGSWEHAEKYANDIIQSLNHWVRGWVDWNMAINLDGGPNWTNISCDAPIVVNATGDEFYRQPTFYALGHFSKFIHRDAHRISVTPEISNNVFSLGIVNPDESIAVVLLNKKSTDVVVTVRDPDLGSSVLTLPRKSISTLYYSFKDEEYLAEPQERCSHCSWRNYD